MTRFNRCRLKNSHQGVINFVVTDLNGEAGDRAERMLGMMLGSHPLQQAAVPEVGHGAINMNERSQQNVHQPDLNVIVGDDDDGQIQINPLPLNHQPEINVRAGADVARTQVERNRNQLNRHRQPETNVRAGADEGAIQEDQIQPNQLLQPEVNVLAEAVERIIQEDQIQPNPLHQPEINVLAGAGNGSLQMNQDPLNAVKVSTPKRRLALIPDAQVSPIHISPRRSPEPSYVSNAEDTEDPTESHRDMLSDSSMDTSGSNKKSTSEEESNHSDENLPRNISFNANRNISVERSLTEDRVISMFGSPQLRSPCGRQLSISNNLDDGIERARHEESDDSFDADGNLIVRTAISFPQSPHPPIKRKRMPSRRLIVEPKRQKYVFECD